MGFSRKPKTERSAEMVQVAADILLEKGLKAATTRDVTSRLGVGNGLLNHYFAWGELRVRAFEAIASKDIEETFRGRQEKSAASILKRMSKEAFSRYAPPYWRLWMEAIDEATTDSRLAEAVNRHASQLRLGLEELLRKGNEEGEWSCSDPEGAAWRILAVHDGLLGFVLVGAPPLDRREAARHFRKAIANECGRDL